jgi:hypothetical protein
MEGPSILLAQEQQMGDGSIQALSGKTVLALFLAGDGDAVRERLRPARPRARARRRTTSQPSPKRSKSATTLESDVAATRRFRAGARSLPHPSSFAAPTARGRRRQGWPSVEAFDWRPLPAAKRLRPASATACLTMPWPWTIRPPCGPSRAPAPRFGGPTRADDGGSVPGRARGGRTTMASSATIRAPPAGAGGARAAREAP